LENWRLFVNATQLASIEKLAMQAHLHNDAFFLRHEPQLATLREHRVCSMLGDVPWLNDLISPYASFLEPRFREQGFR
jgi:hypothetical protein